MESDDVIERAEMLLSSFRAFDTDNSGTISRVEFSALLQQIDADKWDGDKATTLFDSMDKNRNGVIEFTELVNWTCSAPGKSSLQFVSAAAEMTPRRMAEKKQAEEDKKQTERAWQQLDHLFASLLACWREGPRLYNENSGEDVNALYKDIVHLADRLAHHSAPLPNENTQRSIVGFLAQAGDEIINKRHALEEDWKVAQGAEENYEKQLRDSRSIGRPGGEAEAEIAKVEARLEGVSDPDERALLETHIEPLRQQVAQTRAKQEALRCSMRTMKGRVQVLQERLKISRQLSQQVVALRRKLSVDGS